MSFNDIALLGIFFVTKNYMKRNDVISALLGMLIMAITYWLLFYKFSTPEEHKEVRISSSSPPLKNLE